MPSGALTQLPFHALVTEALDTALAGPTALRQPEWLARRNAITILPSVASLKALRTVAKPSQASKPYIGFGNPILDGPDAAFAEASKAARARQHCGMALTSQTRSAMAIAGFIQPHHQSRAPAADHIRSQVPLPETADELCAVARDIGAGEDDVYLGDRNTEARIKSLSANGDLAQHRIVHFATHGALAGELRLGAEPGLVMTPPATGTEEDDGYLSASEVANLKLDADLVILSACNTAAGGADNAEALSGLARAFFYAGARSLLVSHWAVNSEATVKLISRLVGELKANPNIGRAEALRRSMVAMIDGGTDAEAHPSAWAPFILVGEGAASAPAALGAPVAISPVAIAAPPSPSKTVARKGRSNRKAAPKATTDDWRADAFRH